jgi:glycosyltransferase involved in cell wall biosynthesis
MKILLINDYGAQIGGAEVMTFGLRNALRRQGHDVRVFTSSAGTSGHPRLADYQCYGTLSSYRTVLQTFNPSAYRHLRRVLREFQPDVVHVRMFLTQLSPLILLLLRKVPSLYHVVWYRPICLTGTKMLPTKSLCQHSVGVACHQHGCVPLRDWIFLRFQMWLWRRWRHAFKRVVANSGAVRADLLAEGIGPVDVVHNGVEAGPSTRLLSPRPVAVFAGRLVPEKGVDILLRAFAIVAAKIPEARLLIAGEGPERDHLQGLARNLGIAKEVSFIGFIPREQMKDRFAHAWVQVVPSRWAEPFGLVAVEAMMSGIAVIASSIGGLGEIVDDARTGFLVSPEDSHALAEKLVDLLTDRTRAEAMGQAGRMLAEARFTADHQCRQFLSIYDQMRRALDSDSEPVSAAGFEGRTT